MSFEKGEKFLDILRKTGYPIEGRNGQEFEWLFDVGGEFMDWLCEYIDDSNILPPESAFHEEGGEDLLVGDELDKALRDAGVDKEDLLVTESDIQVLKEEIADVDSHIATYEGIMKQLRKECDELESMKNQLKEEEKLVDSKLLEVQDKCCDLGETLDMKYEVIGHNLSSAASSLVSMNDNASAEQSLAQVPLDSFKEQLDLFNDLLSQYINSQFPDLHEGESVLKGPSDAALNKLKEEVNRLQHSISVIVCGVVLERSEERALDSALEYAEQLKTEINWSQGDLDSLRQALEQEEVLFQDLVSTAKVAVQESTVLTILQKIISPECQYKVARQQYWVDKLSSFKTCLEQHLSLVGALTLMINKERFFMTDIITVSNRLQLYLSDEYNGFLLRKNGMEAALRDYQANSRDSLLHSQLAKLMGEDGDLETSIAKHKQDIATLEHEVFTVMLNNKKDVIRRNENNVQDLEKFVFSGPTRKLINFGAGLCVYFNTEIKIQEYEEVVEELKKDKQNTEMDLFLHPYRKKRRLLWIYYLTNPEALPVVFTELKTTVDNMMAIASPSILHSLPIAGSPPLHSSTPKSSGGPW